MAWLLNILNKFKSAQGTYASSEEFHRARAVEQLVRAMDPLMPDGEQVWVKTLFSAMTTVVRTNAMLAWLQHVQAHRSLFIELDRALAQLHQVIYVDSEQRSVFNIRAEWKVFVCRALAENRFDIDEWHDRDQWFQTLLSGMFHSSCRELTAHPSGSTVLNFVQWLVGQHEWARDQALLYRVLHVRDSDDLDAMFYGAANRTLAFVTAMAGIVLRMEYRAPTVACTRLHKRMHAVWPQEMEYIRMFMLLQSQLEGSNLEQVATIAKSFQTSTTGRCAYFLFYGEQLHERLAAHWQQKESLALPPLD